LTSRLVSYLPKKRDVDGRSIQFWMARSTLLFLALHIYKLKRAHKWARQIR